MIIPSKKKNCFAEYTSSNNKQIKAMLSDNDGIEIYFNEDLKGDISELSYCIAEVYNYLDKNKIDKNISGIHFKH